ncbi:MAG: hypothetical protein IJ646_02270 [Clostridia bacterium]|nr:hypothetical protein [Clostridia bacterium]
MRLDENRKLAWVVLAVCVLVSVFALGGAALGRERSRVLKVFNDGADTTLSTRHSMDAYLDAAADSASIMANEAALHMGESDATAQALSDAALIGSDPEKLDVRYKAYTDLKSQVEKLYNGLYSAVSTEEFRNFKLAYDDFWGYDDLIKRDGYHALAKDYNGLISGFPGGVVAGVTGQGALDTFGG